VVKRKSTEKYNSDHSSSISHGKLNRIA
jgi:hypothetical protein